MNHHSRATTDLVIFIPPWLASHRTAPHRITLHELNHTEPNGAVGSLPRLGSLSCPSHVALDQNIRLLLFPIVREQGHRSFYKLSLESTPSQVSSDPASPAYPGRAEYAYPLTATEFATEPPDLFASHASVLGIYTPGPGHEHKWRTLTALDLMI